MKAIIFIISALLLISCQKESNYQCACDIYGIKTMPYNPYSRFARIDQYYNEKERNASEQCGSFQQGYKKTFNDTAKLFPGSWIDCSLTEINYGQK